MSLASLFDNKRVHEFCFESKALNELSFTNHSMSTKPRLHLYPNDKVNVEVRPFEIVERKGFGHPDSITDALGVLISSNYSSYTLREFGSILHHNIDKITISGGVAKPEWGGGEIIEPIDVIFVGKAIREVEIDGKRSLIPIYPLAEDAVHQVFQKVAPKSLVNLSTKEVKPGSHDLITVVSDRVNSAPKANDTSFATSWAPLSKLETLVLEVERFLNGEYKKETRALGTDIKIMGRRFNGTIELNIAAAFLSSELNSKYEYFAELDKLQVAVSERFNIPQEQIFVNTADDREKDSYYITVTGTSLEQGDDGQIGRGNRIRGVIAPYRPQTLEATAGKNPNSHVGNFYNVWASLIADKIYDELGVMNNVALLSTIGKPITACDVFITFEKKDSEKIQESTLQELVEDVVCKWEEITGNIIKASYKHLYPFEFINKY